MVVRRGRRRCRRPTSHKPNTSRRDLIYTLTVVRPGRLSIPYRMISHTELEILESLQPGETVEVWYDELAREDVLGPPLEFAPLLLRRVERFPITAQMLTHGRPRHMRWTA